MTRKTAKKTAARARQQKTGEKYEAALRAETTVTPADLEKRLNDAFMVLNNGLYHRGHNSPTREALWGRIQHAIHILGGSTQEKITEVIEKGGFEAPPVICSNCGATMSPKPMADEKGWWACPLCNAHRVPAEDEIKTPFTPKKLVGFSITRDVFGIKDDVPLCDFTWQAPRTQGYPDGGQETVACTLPKGHQGGPDNKTLRHSYEGPKGTAIFDVPIPPPLRGWGLEPQNIIGQRREGLARLFGRALDACGDQLDRVKFKGAPRFDCDIKFWFDGTLITSRLEHDLKDPVPEKLGFTTMANEVEGNFIPKTVDPQNLMDYWKPLPEARRCTDSRLRLLGVTDDHPEKALVTWTPLTRTKEVPGFGEWWQSLPESKTYDRADHGRPKESR